VNLQILTFKLRTPPSDIPQPDFSEGAWVAICLNPFPEVEQGGVLKRTELEAKGLTREDAVQNIKDMIAELLYKNRYIEQADTCVISL